MSRLAFGERLQAQFAESKRLCVGIDPHPYILAAWGLPDTAEGAGEFAFRVLDAATPIAAAVKPQVAFFERYGAAGFAVLEQLIVAAKQSNILLIADAKRGDVGSSFAAYAQAWLQPGSPLEADALTVNPFQGFEVLSSALELSSTHGKGLFVLAATSNPEAKSIQQAVVAPHTSVSSHILDRIHEYNQREHSAHEMANVGAVLGATVRLADYDIDVRELAEAKSQWPVMPILTPGVGHQGGQLEQVRENFGRLFAGVLINESRSLVEAGPTSLGERIVKRSSLLATFFGGG